jgi:hypothetical protein
MEGQVWQVRMYRTPLLCHRLHTCSREEWQWTAAQWMQPLDRNLDFSTTVPKRVLMALLPCTALDETNWWIARSLTRI